MLFKNLSIAFCIDDANLDAYYAHTVGINASSYIQRIRLLNCTLITGCMFPLFSIASVAYQK